MSAHVLIITTPNRGGVAVRFPNSNAAREWEDKHELEIGTVIGCFPIVSTAAARVTG